MSAKPFPNVSKFAQDSPNYSGRDISKVLMDHIISIMQ